MGGPKAQYIALWDAAILKHAAVESLKKLAPRHTIANPIMFLVEIGSVSITGLWLRDLFGHSPHAAPLWFTGLVGLWLWLTVVFANFAEALAQGRGKAQAETLRKVRKESTARRIVAGREEPVPASSLRRDDVVVVEAHELIPGDGEVIEGVAVVDESAVTGESAPVVRESGGDRSAVTGGTCVLSDRILVRITADPGTSFLDRMIRLVEGASRQKTPNEAALQIVLVGLTLMFLLVCGTLVPMVRYAGVQLSPTTVVALLVCLIPTTIGGLLSAIGIAGMERVVRKNVLAMSARAVEAAGDIDILLLDKTGTITMGNRMATDLLPVDAVPLEQLGQAAYLASIADETPEGRSIVALVEQQMPQIVRSSSFETAAFVPFSAHTRISGCDVDGRVIRKGAVDAVTRHLHSLRGRMPERVGVLADEIGGEGSTPLAVCCDDRALGVIRLKDIIKPGIRDRIARFRTMGIRTLMITGDNPRTAAMIAGEAGVDDFIAEATPETKIQWIRQQQAQGNLVALTGDGINDAPALAQADVGLAMNNGTQAAKEAANMIDLDSDPTKLLEMVEIGRQLLMTRGALTTFSVASDVGKYFAVLPAMLMGAFPALGPLNVMRLASPQSAILAAVIFNAVVMVLLIPLALHGVAYRAQGAAALLRRMLLVYGAGGIVAPFVGIKLIDMALAALGLA